MEAGDIQLILKQYYSNFGTNKLTSRIYTIEKILPTVYSTGDLEGTPKIEFVDISLKTKLILTRFGGYFGTLRFDERRFLNTLSGFTPYWDFKPTNAIHADSPRVYTSDKFLNLDKIDKIQLKCDVIDGNVARRIREPIIFSFLLNKPIGFEVFLEAETSLYIRKKNLFWTL